MTLDWREVLPHPDWEAEPDAVVWVDPRKFDAAWRRGDQWVGPNGETGAQDDRYRRVGLWIEAGNPIDMCKAYVDGEEAGFINGRHRFAYLRDRGVGALPMQVSPTRAKVFARRFGTRLRTSVLPPRGAR